MNSSLPLTQSRLTISVNCSYVKNWNKTLAFLVKLNPYGVVAVIDNLSNHNRILEIKQALPNAIIIARCIIVVTDNGQKKELDGSMHLAPQALGDNNRFLVSPANFLNTWGELGQGGLMLSYFNEPMVAKASPSDISRQVEHMVATIGLATQRSISLCVGNWGVGHQLDGRFDDVIEAVSKQPSLHSLGVHAYAPIDIYGCIDAIDERVKTRGFATPRIQITEYGWDTTGNGDPLNGYKSQPSVNTGVKFANWEIEKFKDVHRPYIERGELEFIATFGWGYAASFPNDDVETDTDWQATILEAAGKGVLSVDTTSKRITQAITPINVLPEAVYGQRYNLSMPGAFINGYVEPSISSGSRGTIPDAAVVLLLDERTVGNVVWWRVGYLALTGWIDTTTVKISLYVPPPAAQPAPAGNPTPTVQVRSISINAVQEQQFRDLAASLRKEADDLQKQSVAKQARAKLIEDLLELPRGA